jgi:hypothetical protein
MTTEALHAVYAVAFGIALAATVGLTWGVGARVAIKDSVILLLAVWLLTRVAQIVTGDFAPYPLNAAIDLLAAYVVYLMARQRWQVLLLASFVFDLAAHCVMFAGGLSTFSYLTVIAIVAYLQLLVVSGVAWHERRASGVGAGWGAWLVGDVPWARD